MQKRFLFLMGTCMLLLASLVAASPVLAAKYVVAPFQVNGPAGYSYLEKAIPPMFSSRLYWEGKFEPVTGQDSLAQGGAPKNVDAAKALLTKQGADYVVWGAVTVMGKSASLDVNVLGPDGNVWKKGVESPLDSLVSGIQTASDAINREVFKRPVSSAAAPRVVTSMNPDIMVNERQAGTVYMNPQIRYQGRESDRIRSQRLEMESRGMAVADLTGDGKNEILLFDEYNLYAYRLEDGRMNKLGEYRFNTSHQPLQVRTIKQGGRMLIVMCYYDKSGKDGMSSILSFTNNQFHEVERRLPYYTNVINLPPMHQPAIIGQNSDRSRIVRGPVFEVVTQGGSFTRGANLSNLPKDANVFNFVWVPGNSSSGGDYVAVIDESEKLLTFDGSERRLAKSDDKFSGSSVGLAHDRSMPGLGSISDDVPVTYYVPMRMIPADLDKDGNYELILNKPISTAGVLFNNYRTYPQGEIHALMWDGIGMELVWKTRRIKGTVVDVSLADADNDGMVDLIVNVNTYPGALGAGKIRTMIVLYPLNLTLTDPGSTIMADDF